MLLERQSFRTTLLWYTFWAWLQASPNLTACTCGWFNTWFERWEKKWWRYILYRMKPLAPGAYLCWHRQDHDQSLWEWTTRAAYLSIHRHGRTNPDEDEKLFHTSSWQRLNWFKSHSCDHRCWGSSAPSLSAAYDEVCIRPEREIGVIQWPWQKTHRLQCRYWKTLRPQVRWCQDDKRCCCSAISHKKHDRFYPKYYAFQVTWNLIHSRSLDCWRWREAEEQSQKLSFNSKPEAIRKAWLSRNECQTLRFGLINKLNKKKMWLTVSLNWIWRFSTKRRETR